MEDTSRYNDIKDLPHHQSKTRRHMALQDRAAQFAPFAALAGYEAMVAEAARYTDREIELTEEEKALLDRKLQALESALASGEQPEVQVTCFEPDSRKDGGAYVERRGLLRRIDRQRRELLLWDQEAPVEIDRILGITGPGRLEALLPEE